jgi:uncharacterized protein (TIGR03435 family)
VTSSNMATVVALFAVAVAGQTKCPLSQGGGVKAQGPAFDVASVKPNKARVRQSMTMTPGGIAYTSVSLIDGLQAAYGVKRYQIAGPDWLGSERYDINARTGGAASNEQIRAMLQTLIADRFKLSLHREKKELPVFAILVGKNGARLTVGDPAGPRSIGPAPGGLAFTNTSMEDLADFLSGLPTISRPVFDKTGLPGRFDFTLRLTAKEGDAGTEETKVAVAQAEPSVFGDALDALGLKLDSQKAAIDMLIVDRADKVPTED